MNRSFFALVALVPLTACAADPGATSTSDADYTGSSYDASMRAACLAALPPIADATGAALDAAALAELGARPELGRGFLDVAHVTCSTRGYGAYETPACARIASSERIDTNYAPSFRVEQHQSYRDVVASMKDGKLALVTAVPDGGVFRPTFAVDGTSSVHVAVRPPQGWTMPDDLQQLGSYAGFELQGSLTNGALRLAHTEAPVVTWNVVQCSRATLRVDFSPAAATAP